MENMKRTPDEKKRSAELVWDIPQSLGKIEASAVAYRRSKNPRDIDAYNSESRRYGTLIAEQQRLLARC